MTVGELLDRIGQAFSRTYQLVADGSFLKLVLSDLGIIAVTVVVFLFVMGLTNWGRF